MRLPRLVLNLLGHIWIEASAKLQPGQVTLGTVNVTSADPIVDLPYAKYAGTRLSNGINQWLGIQYAAPPIGDLRFAPPADPPVRGGVQDAKTQGPLCIATGTGTIPTGQSEDCLYLAVYTPSSATQTSKLPVFVFIQGGGFNSDANPDFNGTGLIEASGYNIIVVTFNYRVGPWGFLASSSSASGIPTANNGLHDQRKALQWVQSHISAFGGDPGHVVLGGASAGAASIALHMTAYGGRDDKLFHAAAASSVSFAPVLTPSESQYQYKAFARAVGCLDSDAALSLKCLRSKSAAELESHNHNIPYHRKLKAPIFMFDPTLDGDFVTDLTYVAFATGKFVDVPVIIGDDTNGGTVFAPQDASSQQDSNNFLSSQFPSLSSSQLSETSKLYPVPTHDCPADKCWWRQISNAYGDMRYMCPGLYISSAFANVSSTIESKHSTRSTNPEPVNYVTDADTQHLRIPRNNSYRPLGTRSTSESRPAAKSWAYRYNVEDPTQIENGLGVPHTVELNAIFGPDNVPPGGVPASYQKYKSNENIVPVMQAYWTSFIRTFNPNTHKLEWSTTWDEYYNSKEQPQRIVFQNAGMTQMEAIDSGTRQRCAYLQSIGPSIKQKV